VTLDGGWTSSWRSQDPLWVVTSWGVVAACMASATFFCRLCHEVVCLVDAPRRRRFDFMPGWRHWILVLRLSCASGLPHIAWAVGGWVVRRRGLSTSSGALG
jgi:hypothetical protein